MKDHLSSLHNKNSGNKVDYSCQYPATIDFPKFEENLFKILEESVKSDCSIKLSELIQDDRFNLNADGIIYFLSIINESEKIFVYPSFKIEKNYCRLFTKRDEYNTYVFPVIKCDFIVTLNWEKLSEEYLEYKQNILGKYEKTKKTNDYILIKFFLVLINKENFFIPREYLEILIYKEVLPGCLKTIPKHATTLFINESELNLFFSNPEENHLVPKLSIEKLIEENIENNEKKIQFLELLESRNTIEKIFNLFNIKEYHNLETIIKTSNFSKEYNESFDNIIIKEIDLYANSLKKYFSVYYEELLFNHFGFSKSKDFPVVYLSYEYLLRSGDRKIKIINYIIDLIFKNYLLTDDDKKDSYYQNLQLNKSQLDISAAVDNAEKNEKPIQDSSIRKKPFEDIAYTKSIIFKNLQNAKLSNYISRTQFELFNNAKIMNFYDPFTGKAKKDVLKNVIYAITMPFIDIDTEEKRKLQIIYNYIHQDPGSHIIDRLTEKKSLILEQALTGYLLEPQNIFINYIEDVLKLIMNNQDYKRFNKYEIEDQIKRFDIYKNFAFTKIYLNRISPVIKNINFQKLIKSDFESEDLIRVS